MRGLRKEIDRTCEVDLVEVFLCFDDQRGSFDLPGESDHFGMSPLAEYHDLPSDLPHLFVCFDDAPLEFGHDRAGRVDQLDAQLFRQPVGRRRFAVRPDEEAPSSQFRHLIVGHRVHAEPFEPLHFDAVVYDVPQREDLALLLQSLFRAGDRSHDSKQKPEWLSISTLIAEVVRYCILCDAVIGRKLSYRNAP